jgi:hypothetical protein
MPARSQGSNVTRCVCHECVATHGSRGIAFGRSEYIHHQARINAERQASLDVEGTDEAFGRLTLDDINAERQASLDVEGTGETFARLTLDDITDMDSPDISSDVQTQNPPPNIQSPSMHRPPLSHQPRSLHSRVLELATVSKSERNQRTTKAHDVLDAIVLRIRACTESLKPPISHETLRFLESESLSLHSALEKVTRQTESVFKHKREVAEMLEQFEGCILELKNSMQVTMDGPVYFDTSTNLRPPLPVS